MPIAIQLYIHWSIAQVPVTELNSQALMIIWSMVFSWNLPACCFKTLYSFVSVLLASNGNIFPQENEADMSLFLSESSFGSENNAFCDFGSGASDYLNIFNEPSKYIL